MTLCLLAFVSVALVVATAQLLIQRPSIVTESVSQYFRQRLHWFRPIPGKNVNIDSSGTSVKQRISQWTVPSSGGVVSVSPTRPPAVTRGSKSSSARQRGEPVSAAVGKGPRKDSEQQHVFFLKVHKAASTTVMNILYRFALKRQLNVMLPKKRNILSEFSKRWRSAAVDLPPGVSHFDILCNHLVFNERVIRDSLYPDTKFIGIVREPLSQFVSAFNYYSNVFKVKYLMHIPGPVSLRTYMQFPARWEGHRFGASFTHNRMSFDFGMNASGLMGDHKHIMDYVTYLNRTFDLVMVSERFDESMVLLKRLLGWSLQDILYAKNNVFQKTGAGKQLPQVAQVHQYYNLTARERQLHRDFNLADYALYEHFSKLFQQRVEAEEKNFAEEVATFRFLLQQVAQFCSSTKDRAVSVAATKWSDSFQLSRSDCKRMTIDELALVHIQRQIQLKRSAG